MIEERNGFECTDNDCMQYRKLIGNRKYLFVQEILLDENEYCVVANVEDLTKMSLQDIEYTIRGYYGDIPSMEKSYKLPLGQLDDIIAECSFENHAYSDRDYDYESKIVTLKAAEEIIQKFIDTDGEVFEKE